MESKPWEIMAPMLAEMAVLELQKGMRAAFTEADDALFKLAENGSHAQEHMDSVRILRQEKEKLLSDWATKEQEAFLTWGRGKIKEDVFELALVDFDELEENLAVQQMSNSFEKANSQLFVTSESIWRQAWREMHPELADNDKNSDGMDIDEDVRAAPLMPEGLAQSVSSWLAQTSIATPSKVVLLKIIERVLSRVLADTLKQVILLFKSSGWEIKTTQQDQARVKQQQLRKEEKPIDVVEEDVIPINNDWLDTVKPIENAMDEAPRFDAPLIDLNLNNEYLNQSEKWGNFQIPHLIGEQGGQEIHVSDQLADQVAKAMYELLGPGGWKRQFEMEGNLLNEEIGHGNWDANLGEFLTLLKKRRVLSENKPSKKNVFDGQLVRETLKFFQKQPPSLEENIDISLSQLIKNNIIDHIKSTHEFEIIENKDDFVLSESDEDAADVVGMVFEVFLRDRDIHESVGEKILLLLSPYIRIAIDDRKMFMNKKHPARRFLDTVALACEGNAGHTLGDKLIFEKVYGGVKHILLNFEDDLNPFDEAAVQIKDVIDKQEDLIRKTEQRSVDAMRSQERLDIAETKAREVFLEELKNSHWPTRTIEAVSQHWCAHYKILFLQSQNQNSDPVKGRQNLEDAKTLLQKIVSIGNHGVQELMKNPQETSKFHIDLSIMLASSGIIENASKETALNLLGLLDQAYRWKALSEGGKIERVAEKLMDTPKPIPQVDPLKEVETAVWIAPEKIALHKRRITSSDFPSDQDLMDYFSNMPLNTWVDFVKADGSNVPAKLQFVSPISMRLIFVTAKGLKHAMESPKDLAILVKMDRLRLREYAVGEGGFEHSFKKAIKTLDQQTDINLAEVISLSSKVTWK